MLELSASKCPFLCTLLEIEYLIVVRPNNCGLSEPNSVTMFFEDVGPLAIPISKPIVVQILFKCVPFIEITMKRGDRLGHVRGRSKTE